MRHLQDKIKSKNAKIGIVGMGYIGIPLGIEFSKKGFTVLGFDKDPKRVNDINAGKQIMKHITKNVMKKFVTNNGSATADFSNIKNMDCLIICVPTPLDKHKQPDMSYIESASLEISKNLRKKQLIVLVAFFPEEKKQNL